MYPEAFVSGALAAAIFGWLGWKLLFSVNAKAALKVIAGEAGGAILVLMGCAVFVAAYWPIKSLLTSRPVEWCFYSIGLQARVFWLTCLTSEEQFIPYPGRQSRPISDHS